ncbi:lactate dehydrogenase [Clostridium sp. MCC353]|uniref:D-isomer specific 2-hydroxyacid dehydrogenase family protein n=1 Tax=Clostridium sp. MCC353 TaxID=2592646 RepID=UPI001C0339F8|nr:D-isomer specific 2-hydroxyacid dehydrogenase family protein [Clostridium sp. MCC353]MBT9775143.1 lactate dehydrogenase [Clostridium sp. MCC353]
MAVKICAFGVRDDELDVLQQVCSETGVDVTIIREEPGLEYAGHAKGCMGVTVSGQTWIGKELLDRYYELGVRYLTTRTRGYNHIDVDYARKIGIRCAFATYPPNSVAEFTVMMMLMCLRQYKQSIWRGQVNDFALSGLLGTDLGSLTVGVMGTGQIGFQVIRCLQGFGCKILAYDPYENDAVKPYAEYVSMDELFQRSDLLTLHLPYLPDTYHMINEESLKKMRDGVVIINCARGELADTESLIQGVESGKIGALGLDTVEGENGIVHGDHRIDILANRNIFYLRQFRNVVMTPHMAFFTQTSVDSMVKCGIRDILAMEAGEKCWDEI